MKTSYGSELLTKIFRIARAEDPGETVRTLYEKFGGFSAVIDAEPHNLTDDAGLLPDEVLLLKLIPVIVRRKLCEEHKMPKKITDTSFGDALLARYFAVNKEMLTVVSADASGKILGIMEVEQAYLDRVHFDLRRVMDFAYHTNARNLVLVHNHPEGFATPSSADIAAQAIIREIMRRAEINLYDQIIIGDDDYVSLLRS